MYEYGTNDLELGMIGKLFIIPSDPKDNEFLLSVDKKAQSLIRSRFGYALDYDWQANTIANVMVDTIISELGMRIQNNAGSMSGLGFMLNFYDLLFFKVTNKTNSKAEKEGNINIAFEAGPRALELIKNGPTDHYTERVDPKKFFDSVALGIGDEEDQQMFNGIDRRAMYTLVTNHGLKFGNSASFPIFSIGYTFIECLFMELLYRVSSIADDSGLETIVSVNFNDTIEFHASKKDDTVTFMLHPGMNAKLAIKSDSATEDTMGE